MKNENFSRGLSGCSLFLNDNGTVTKSSPNSEYNKRLLRQIEKQNYFNSLSIDKIKSPLIFNVLDTSELYSFDMEYISGNTYLDFLNYSSVDYINFFLDSIFSYFDYLDSGNSSYYSDTEFIKCCIEKLDSIKDKLYNKDFIIYLEDKIKKINKSNIPRTFCHGDLTLSNILFSSDSLFFLDFLDSYVDSWIVDLVKIKQDLYYLWNVKKDTDFPNLRSVQISLYLWKKIEDRYKDIVISEEFKILEILNFLRIYPYIKTEKEKLLLNEIIERIPIYEEFNNTHGGKIL
jgi:hypothetical protein